MRVFLLAVIIALAGCAAPGTREVQHNPFLPRQHELTDTPFYPQSKYQCGPAALATLLTSIGIRTHPDQLTPDVYVPERKGSLQIEMMAATRRHGGVPVQIAPTLDALLQEVSAGNPVLILQNLGFSWVPTWHYAVVVGYDLDAGSAWLRSGTEKRQTLSLRALENTWSRSNHWGFVTVKPGQLPATATVNDMARALLAFEKTALPAQVKIAYAAAAERWPEHLVILMGLGNANYRMNQLTEASDVFRQATHAHPQSAAAHNNLAHVLLELGKLEEAQASVNIAMSLAGKDPALADQVRQTQLAIARRMAAKSR